MSTAPATPSPRPPRRWRRALLARFRKDRSGVAAVEFALVALPFFGIIFAILEISLHFWANQVLETMVSDASRRIYTGQFQQGNAATTDEAQLLDRFKRLMCLETVDGAERPRAALFNCMADVKLDIRARDDFPDRIEVPTLDSSTNRLDTRGWGYRPSQPREIVVVRAALEMPLFVSVFGRGNLGNGRNLIMATAVFRNEPF